MDFEDKAFATVGCGFIALWLITALASLALTIAFIYFLVAAAQGRVF